VLQEERVHQITVLGAIVAETKAGGNLKIVAYLIVTH
jgi:hypothetical protein